MKLHFWKVQGLGNDFALFDGRGLAKQPDWNAAGAALCHRRTGIGADGVVIVLPSKVADVRMRIVNSDGSEAEMCGNATRCFAKFVFEHGIVRKDEIRIETLAGVMVAKLRLDGDTVTAVRVDMGEPIFDCERIPAAGEGRFVERPVVAGGREVVCTALRIGVPHVVVFVDRLDEDEVLTVGPAVEHAADFPAMANVNFVHVLDDRTVELRTWERGCGRTLACGTGSSSTAVACALTNRTGRSVDVRLDLGTLHIDWAENNHVYMEGPAAYAFEGEIDVE